MTCPSCHAAIWTELDADFQTVGETDHLWGRDLHCGRCAHEFEVLFYPQEP